MATNNGKDNFAKSLEFVHKTSLKSVNKKKKLPAAERTCNVRELPAMR